MKIFVTGGLGQIGSHVVEMLLERGAQIEHVDNIGMPYFFLWFFISFSVLIYFF